MYFLMKDFNLNVVGTKQFIDAAKEEIKKNLDAGKTIDESVEIVFGSFPKDTKDMIKRDLKRYL